MSTSSPPLDRPVTAAEIPVPATAGRRTVGRLLRSELGMIFRRRRNLVLLAVLALIPVLIGTAIKLASSSPNPGEGPQFIDRIAGNGLFLSLTAMVVVLPLFLPMAVSVVAGDSIAGEANLGTLRYLLAAPVVAAAGVITGAALFPIGRVTLLSGTTIALSEAMLRTLLVALYVGVSMAGLAAIGLLASTLTEVPVGAMAATLTLSIISQVLDSIPQVSVIHPYLFTHRWLAFGDLLRDPVAGGELWLGIATQAAWAAVCASLAWARFSSSDVSS